MLKSKWTNYTCIWKQSNLCRLFTRLDRLTSHCWQVWDGTKNSGVSIAHKSKGDLEINYMQNVPKVDLTWGFNYVCARQKQESNWHAECHALFTRVNMHCMRNSMMLCLLLMTVDITLRKLMNGWKEGSLEFEWFKQKCLVEIHCLLPPF